MSMVNEGAAAIIEEKDLTAEKLMQTVDDMLSDPKRLEQYSENAKKLAITDSNDRILSIIKKYVKL